MRILHRQLDEREAFSVLLADLDFVMDGQFYVKRSQNEKGLIPYCPVCLTADRKAVHLTPVSGPGAFHCCTHNTRYYTKQYEQWKLRQNELGEAEYRRNNRISDI